VSPPPATLIRVPACVSSATFFATATVPRSKGGVSKAPSGPFHTRVCASSRYGSDNRVFRQDHTAVMLVRQIPDLARTPSHILLARRAADFPTLADYKAQQIELGRHLRASRRARSTATT